MKEKTSNNLTTMLAIFVFLVLPVILASILK